MKPSRLILVTFLLASFALPAQAAAVPEAAVLSGGGDNAAELALAVARHHYFQRQLERERTAVEKTVQVTRFDQIAILEDDGSLIIPPRLFDLPHRSIQFLRRPQGMSVVRSDLGVKDLLGERLDLGNDDAVRIDFPAGFEFPFFEHTYTSVDVSSDGLLTFGVGVPVIDPEVDDLLFGYPRIAPILTDLDPTTQVTERTGVYVNFLNKRARFSWIEVPLHGDMRRVTAQVTLFDNGRIVFAYGDVEALDAVIGIFPGGYDTDAFQADFSAELPLAPRRAAIYAIYSNYERLESLNLVRSFYRHFEDRYDQIVLWYEPLSGRGTESIVTRNDVLGIGVPVYDISHVFGSQRLSNIVWMGSIHNYPDDPDQNTMGTYSTLDLLAAEVGRRWFGPLRFVDADGGARLDLMGADLMNWSFHVDSDASFLGGNDIDDLGGGVFETVAATSRYCPLDQYLMGLIPPEAVPSFFFVDGVTDIPADAPPVIGATMEGDRVDLSVWDVIAAEGPRVPASADSPKLFKMAFVILARAGEPPPQSSLDKLNTFRRRWVRFFNETTDFNGRVGTALWPRETE